MLAGSQKLLCGREGPRNPSQDLDAPELRTGPGDSTSSGGGMPSGAAPTKRLKFVYSMEMRSAHGSAGGPVVVAWLAKGGVDCSDVGAGELRAAEVGAAEGLGATMGGAAASVFDFSSGGAMSRASTG